MNKGKSKTFSPISYSISIGDRSAPIGRRNDKQRDEALVALKKGNLKLAEELCRRILNRDNKNADAYYILALIAGETGQVVTAVKTLDMAISLNDTKSEYYAQKARFLLPLARNREAAVAAMKAFEMNSNDAFQLDTIGCALSQLGLQKEAKKMFIGALKHEPDNYKFLFNYGNALRFLGEFKKAETQIEKCLKLQPDHYIAHWVISGLKKQSKTSNHVDRLREKAKKLSASGEAQTFLNYALGKEFEDMEDYDRSFEYLDKGARAQRSTLNYNIETDKELIDTLINKMDMSFFEEQIDNCESNEPIFILGLPRSGTTLVERIIGSHSDVYAAGELLNFGVEAKWLSEVSGRNMMTPEVITSLISKDLSDLGRLYIESTRGTTGKAKHFIDKLPFNFLYIGLIAKVLPNASIIHVKRNPMDSCFSMFKQKFALAYPYSYDLCELGQYYVLYKQLMDHWHSVLPGRIHDVSYEDLVNNQEHVSKKLIEYCGLDWQDQCLRFHKNKEAVSTASAAQVRKPIYKGSLEKWRCYEKHLEPLMDVFRKNNIDFDS